MGNEGTGIVIGVLAIVIIALFYLAVVGQIVISYYVYFSFLDRVGFGILGFLIIIGLLLIAKN